MRGCSLAHLTYMWASVHNAQLTWIDYGAWQQSTRQSHYSSLIKAKFSRLFNGPSSTGTQRWGAFTFTFLTFTLEPKCSRPFHYVNEKRSREGEHCHMSLPFAFHLRQTHFRAVSHNHFWSNQHNHFWSNQHNHSDHHRVILSRSGLTFLDMSLWNNPD